MTSEKNEITLEPGVGANVQVILSLIFERGDGKRGSNLLPKRWKFFHGLISNVQGIGGCPRTLHDKKEERKNEEPAK
jgi:hypothetical protein